MNFLYLIGNGFDVNLKIRTDYQSFYDYYLAQVSADDAVKMVKNDMEKNRYEQWSDLELGLGKFTSQLKRVDELRTVCYDINVSLKNYLTQTYDARIAELKKHDLMQSLTNYLVHPEAVFNTRTRNAIHRFYSLFGNKADIVDVITFNYTNTIEDLLWLDNIPNDIPLETKDNSYPINFGSINHIHGTLSDNDVIVGVNDISQIANEEFRSTELTSFLMVKPTITEQRGDLLDDNCEQLIRRANVICLFGLSVGETDKKWWNLISDRMRADTSCIILYYAFDDNDYTHDADIFNHQSELKYELLAKLGLKDIAHVSDCVFVAYKSGMFDLKR